jgi:DNA-binding MurR/RpiR family transcriptional regulator
VTGGTAPDPSPALPGTSVVDRVRRGLPGLTRAERRVARTVLAGYPVSGLGTVADLAATSSTSSASVVRLVQKLGFEGYSQFQSAIREELATRASGPADRLDRAGPDGSEGRILARLAGAASSLVASIPETVPESEFAAAVELLCDRGRPVKILGGRVTGLLGEYLQHHLSRARPQVSMLDADSRGRHAALLDITRRDVLVVLDVRRYTPDIAAIATTAARRGATVVLLTDVLMSPIASIAQVVLPTRVDAPSPFDTTVAVLVVVEALATAVVTHLGEAGVGRMRAWDALAEAPTTGAPPALPEPPGQQTGADTNERVRGTKSPRASST